MQFGLSADATTNLLLQPPPLAEVGRTEAKK
jgi:hypothetical protein